MYTYPSVTINNMTFTALRWGQFPTISYTVGATAGSEVVTLASTLANINIQIESGVSTNAQIKAAVEAALGNSVKSLYARDLTSISIAGGHTADTNIVQAPVAMTGAVNVPAPTIPADGFIPPLLRVDPVNPAEGQVWYNTTGHVLKFFDGTDVQVVAVE